MEVLIDEGLAEPMARRYRPFEGRFLLSIVSGRMVVAGVEEIGKAPRGNAGAIDVPAGDYVVTCYLAEAYGGEDEGEFASIAEVEKTVLTSEERAYYRKVGRAGLLRAAMIWVILLSFFLFRWLWGWKLAIGVVLAMLVPYAHWLEWRAKHRTSEKWKAINQKVVEAWERNTLGDFVLELRRAEGRDSLHGGSVSIDELPLEPRGFQPIQKKQDDGN